MNTTTAILTGFGVVLAIIAIGIGLYFGLRSDGERNPQLAIINGPVPLFDPELTTSFELVPKPGRIIWGEPLENEAQAVWGVTLAVWNAGSVAIRREHVLSQMRLRVGLGERIPTTMWELRLLERSREVTNFNALVGDIEAVDGFPEIPIEFDILEESDGARLLLIYSGERDIPITLRGTVEGRKGIEVFLRSKELSVWRLLAGILSVILGIVGFLSGIFWFDVDWWNRRGRFGLGGYFASNMLVGAVFTLGLLLFITGKLNPLTEIPAF